VTKKENKKNLKGKPSWTVAPSWARWLSQNIYGQWWWHSRKPSIMTITWINHEGSYDDSGYKSNSDNWRESLESRPKVK